MLTTLADTAPNLNKYFMRFKEFITETFVNIIGFDDTAQEVVLLTLMIWLLKYRFGRLQCEQENL